MFIRKQYKTILWVKWRSPFKNADNSAVIIGWIFDLWRRKIATSVDNTQYKYVSENVVCKIVVIYPSGYGIIWVGREIKRSINQRGTPTTRWLKHWCLDNMADIL